MPTWPTLKKQTDNLRILLASVEAEVSERQGRTALTDTMHAWLLALRRRLAEVEEDTPEGFEKRKQLVGLLVESISLGRSQQEGRAEVQITYRFGPPPGSDGETDGLSMPHFKNGSAFLAANAKAKDADKLDGLDSSSYLKTSSKASDSDKLDGKDSTSFANGTNGKANDANLLDGKDSTDFLPRKTYRKDGASVDNPGGIATVSATCDAGDLALSGGYLSNPFRGDIHVFSERTEGDTYRMSFVADNIVTANVTCADFPPLR